jgi:hypothetical protein
MKTLLLSLALLASVTAFADTCGKTTIGASGDAGDTNLIIWVRCTPAAPGTVADAKVYVGTYFSGHITAAVYDSDGTSGQPKTQLCPGGSVSPSGSNGWVTVALTNCGTLLAGHDYWLGINEDGGPGNVEWKYDTGGSNYFSAQTCCTWPATAGSNNTIANTYSAYLDITSTSATRKPTGWIQ